MKDMIKAVKVHDADGIARQQADGSVSPLSQFLPEGDHPRIRNDVRVTDIEGDHGFAVEKFTDAGIEF